MEPKHADAQFPLSGIDRSAAFAQQPKKGTLVSRTTVLGVNVLAAESITGRERGGSRPGIVKYLETRIGD